MSFGKLGLVLIIASGLFGGLALAMASSLDQEVGKALATGDGQFMIFLGLHPVLEQVHKGNQFIMVLQYATLFAGVLGLASVTVAFLSRVLSFIFGGGESANRDHGLANSQLRKQIQTADTVRASTAPIDHRVTTPENRKTENERRSFFEFLAVVAGVFVLVGVILMLCRALS